MKEISRNLMTMIGDEKVEWRKLNDVLLSITTGLNPRKNFRLNDLSEGELTSWYITTKDYSADEKISFADGKTARITEDARKLINNRSKLARGDVLLSAVGTVGKIALVDIDTNIFDVNESTFVLKPKTEAINTKFLVHFLRSDDFQNEIRKNLRGSTLAGIRKETLEKIEIPVPTMAVQERVVAVLDRMTDLTAELTAELKLRSKQYSYYRDYLLDFAKVDDSANEITWGGVRPKVAWKTLGEIAEIGTGSGNTQDAADEGKYPFYIRSKDIKLSDKYIFDETAIVIPGEGGVGDIFHFVQGKYNLHQRAYRIHITFTGLNPKFAYYWFEHCFKKYIMMRAVSATVLSIRKPMLEKFEIPVPPMEEQKRIVGILDKFDKLTNDISEGLPREIALREKQYEYFREKLFDFAK